MPKLKQPMSLQDQVVQSVVKMTRKAYVSCIRKLDEAAEIGREAYLKEKQNVVTDCDKLHDLLESFPIGIKKHIAPLIVRKAITMITTHDKTSNKLKRASWYRDEEHNNVCAKMLSAVPLTCIGVCDITHLCSSFAEKLINQTLHSVPNLTMLALYQSEINNSALLAKNIHHLTQLQHFQYEDHCTDEVVEQLALHCAQLKTINARFSIAVTDASVQHLMILRKLEYTYLGYTSIRFQTCSSFQNYPALVTST
jgi:hypothetical protein